MLVCLPVPGRADWWSVGRGATTEPHRGSRLQPAGKKIRNNVIQRPEHCGATEPYHDYHVEPSFLVVGVCPLSEPLSTGALQPTSFSDYRTEFKCTPIQHDKYKKVCDENVAPSIGVL